MKRNPWPALAMLMITGGGLYLAHLIIVLEIIAAAVVLALLIWAACIAWDGAMRIYGKHWVMIFTGGCILGIGLPFILIMLAAAFPAELWARHCARQRPPVQGPQMVPQTTGGQR